MTETAVATGGRRASQPLRRSLAVLLGSAGAVLLVCLIVAVVSLVQLADSRRAVLDRIVPAALGARDLRTALVDQETGVRGYALSGGDRSFLQPYEQGRTDETARLRRLHDLLDGQEPALAAAVADAEAAIRRWHDESAERTIAGVDRNDPTVRADVFLAASKARFDEVRGALDRLDDALTTERRTRSDNLFATSGQVAAAVGVLAAAIVVVGGLLFIALRRWVTDPLEALSEQVRVVAGGELAHEVSSDSSAEMVSLAADIDAMRTRILNELGRLQEATAAVERQAADLARSNADLEQFAYVASHDLQEPLRKVAGFCQLLQRRYGGQLDERADEYIHYAVDGAQRMQQLINDLLAFSRVGRTTESFEDVDLTEAARRALDNLDPAIEAAGATVELPDGLPTVPGDPRLLVALFQNLIGNGIKFARPDIPPRVELTVTTPEDGDAVELAVTDNGIGIDPQYGEQIFTLFKRLHTKSEYQGTGIGLALCKRIVEFHGGRIELAEPNGSTPGATFRLTLPLRPIEETHHG